MNPPQPNQRRPILVRAFDRVCRDPESGALAIVQRPNLPLGLYLAATALRLVADPQGGLRTVTAVLAGLGLLWWALDEIVRGDSPFRRVLGAVVLIGLVLGRLGH